MRLGWPEILLILAIVLIVFGVGKLPQVGGALGKSIRSFRKAQAGEDDEDEKGKSVAKSETKSEKKSESA